jgi:hypothetical protein|tara:strand:- start:343 stop:468 length:126 start_codon:yes stop_codon:yes gene_type:complete
LPEAVAAETLEETHPEAEVAVAADFVSLLVIQHLLQEYLLL